MKPLKNISLIKSQAVICMLLSFLLFGCSKDREKIDPLAQMQKRLRGTWTVSKVTLSGLDVTIFYQNLVLNLNTNYRYECQNEVDPVWPISGNYENSIENNLRIITRDDGVKMTVVSLTTSSLVIQFPWAGAGGGKVLNLNGEYEFTFSR